MKKIKHHVERAMTYTKVRKTLGVLCLVWGVFALFTPFTPGGLPGVLLGLVLLYGKEETRIKMKSWLGEKRYHAWKLDTFFEEKQ